MTMHWFQLFLSVAKHRNVTQAARELNISQSSVSHQLKFLRDEFRPTLYKRTGWGIVLTDEGQELQKEVEFIFSYIEGLKKKYNTKVGEPILGSLTVGGSPGLSTSSLPALVAVFRNGHPRVNLTLLTGSSPKIEDLLLGSKVDIAIITSPVSSPSLHIEPYRQERLVAFVPIDDPLAKKKKIELTELARLPLVIGTGKEGANRTDELLGTLREKGLKPKAMRFEAPDAVKAAVKRGAGVGILYHDFVKEEVRGGEFKILKLRGVDLMGQSYIAYSKEKPLSKNAQEFLELLRAAKKKSNQRKVFQQLGLKS